ncbi:glycosyl hydrolase family 8 [Bacillus sp. T33-2]|uniref:glycosyl hydrolase family 8 n=1 Tax=Bacillus sp. T33-2 TaxID=2054168 RepID=UPI000C7876B0|nr:glycosyl hydrolase family 8 [Bacillus sp. T33-2]PLR96051.1 hypothetical protein CVD19_12105 [Bacillus sp. T33-2]
MFKLQSSKFPTENFIVGHMVNTNGTLATYLQDSGKLDSDLVQGREALSETLGLWMQYALEKNDRKMFEKSFELLTRYFMSEDGLVYWKLEPSGLSDVSTNATVDDLRIVGALFNAADLWGSKSYQETAVLISNFLTENNRSGNLLSDYYDARQDSPGDRVTLSYIDPSALADMARADAVPAEVYQSMIALLAGAPEQNGFYAKSFNIKTGQYQFDQEVNMIDQMLVAINLNRIEVNTRPLLHFIKKEFNEQGAILGRYNNKTKKPTVKYESPALYGLAIMYCVETGEEELALSMYTRMVQFRVDSVFSKHYGAYSINRQKDTHIFDNLIPLLAERKLYNAGLL